MIGMEVLWMKLNKMREEMAQSFLSSLKEDKIPWRKEWSSLPGRSFNAVTQTPYRGTNLFWLFCQQQEKGYQDPRWCTFNQAKKKGWNVKKGEKGTKVEFWSLYDKETKKKLTQTEAMDLRDQLSPEEYLQRVKPISSVYTVFNGEQIEGIPAIDIEKYTWDAQELLEKRDVLFANMKVNFVEQGWEAYYSPDRDLISLPEVNNFENEYAYFSTLLHEAAHATGHSSRLDREFGIKFSDIYAKEELRAEIASAFTSQVLGIDSMNQEHMENHKAYVQSWIDVLKNNPDELFAAIKDAEKISDYLIEKGEFDLEQNIQLSEHQNNIKKEEANENHNVTILGYYQREDNTQFIHYSVNDKEYLTSGVVMWDKQENIQRYLEKLQPFQTPHLNDRDTMMTYLQRFYPYSEITRYMNELVGEISFYNGNDVGEVIQYTSASDYLKDIEDEMEYRSTSGFQFQTFSKEPEIRKGVDDIIHNLYGEENPHDLDYYKNELKDLSPSPDKTQKEYDSYVREHGDMVKLATEGRTTIVINAFGGPGSGKTTSCMDICADLKKMGYNAEYVQEYAKELVYDKNFDLLDGSAANQFTILKEQMRRMDRLMGQTDFIVTDSPILLNSIYNQELTPEYEKMVSDLSGQYQNFAFFMKRDEKQFQSEGRIHNLEESKEKDQEIRDLLDKHHIYYGSYTHDTIGVVVKNAVANYHKVQRKQEKHLSQQNNAQEIEPSEYNLIQNVAFMEEKLNIPADTRMTKWNGDLALYESKMNVSTAELQSTYEEFQQYHMPLLSVQEAAKVRLAVKGRSIEGYKPEPLHLKVAELVKEYQDSGMDTKEILSRKISDIGTKIGVSDDKYTVNLVCSIAAKDRYSYEEYMKEIVNGDIIPEKIDKDLQQPKEQEMSGIFGEKESVTGKFPFPKDAMSTIKNYINDRGKSHATAPPKRMLGGLER